MKKLPLQIIALVLFSMLMAASVKAQTTIPFALDDDGHIVVKARVNGVEGNFMFDTGAGITLLTSKFAEKVTGLKKLDGTYTGFRETGEKMENEVHQAKTLTIGKLVDNNPPVIIYKADWPIDGLVSMMSFVNQPFTFDYVNKVLVLESPQSIAKLRKSGKIIPLQLSKDRDKDYTCFAYFKVNDKLTLQVVLDSGAGTGVYLFNARFMEALGIDSATAKKTYHASEFNTQLKTPNYHATIKTMAAASAAGVKCENVRAAFIPGLIYDGATSIEWFGKHLTFDMGKSELIVN